MTPGARWRPSGLPASAFIVGPAACQGCGDPVWYGRSTTRVQGLTVVGEVRAWREWGAYRLHRCVPLASRARAWDNDADEYSVPIAHNAQRPSARLYSGSEGVDIPEYRRNA